MIVRLAGGLLYQKFALGRWSRIPSCVSTYVFSAQRSIYKKKGKDTPCTGSKLNNYFLRSDPLHDYFLRSVNRSRHYKYTTINI
jgi:hypothetical protein